MKIAIIGVTGLVGQTMLKVLKEHDMLDNELILVASPRSVGKKIDVGGKSLTVIAMEEAILQKPDIALFSVGSDLSLKYAPAFAELGTRVIDNSSAWRMNPNHKLIVDGVNNSQINDEDYIIANPNCSTMQLVLALQPIHEAFGIKRLVISTYQSYTGTGMNAVKQYQSERSGEEFNRETAAYPYQIFENCIPQCDIFMENGYTKEELKMVNETRKILGDENIQITATAVRVPVFGGHSESVNIETHKPFEIGAIKDLLEQKEGVTIMDDIHKEIYPTPLAAYDKDEVYVGRIRKDFSMENALNMWIVSDNLRKGAATNAVQICKYLVKNGILGKNAVNRQPMSM